MTRLYEERFMTTQEKECVAIVLDPRAYGGSRKCIRPAGFGPEKKFCRICAKKQPKTAK
jgi:hypothetical protein